MKYVFWTGGWDSTFVMLKNAKENVEGTKQSIQPVYMIGDNRPSEKIEIDTMNTILPMLRAISEAEIRDVLLIDKRGIPEDSSITQAFERIREQVKIGTQYESLAKIAKQFPGIEIGIEKPNGEYNGCVDAIEKNGSFIYKDGSYYVDKAVSSNDCLTLFGNVSFPIVDITEIEMVQQVHEWRAEEIMKKIWFCHAPINNRPCGFCRPCQQKMECGMEWLLPANSQKNYRHYKQLQKAVSPKFANLYARIERKLSKQMHG